MTTKPQRIEENGSEDLELAEGWTFAALGDGLVVDVQPGFACGENNREATGIAHLRPMNISAEGFIDLLDLKYVPTEEAARTERLVRSGDVVFNNTNSPELVGKSALYDLLEPRAFSNHMTRLRCRAETLLSPYCALALHHLWQLGYFQDICNNHVSQASVSREVLLNTRIPLAPFAEQERIVAQAGGAARSIGALKKRLAKISPIIARYRQAVLAAACSGKLTQDWRAAQPVNTTVDRTDAISLQHWPDLPETWKIATVDSLCDLVVDCPHSTPKWTTHGVICLRTTNFRPGSLDLDEVRFVSNETYQERIVRTAPVCNDVLYSREGGILGIACLFPANLKACLGQRMMLMRATRELVLPTFLMHVLNSAFTLAHVKDLTTGSSSPHLNVGDIKAFSVPLPPQAEQQEIIRRVESFFNLADAIEKRVAAASVRVERLTQAVLAKAFRGELVPTEAELARHEGRTYEPASALVERIKAEKAKASGNGTKRRKTSK